MWTRLFALVVKEFLVLFKDKKGRVVLVMPPVIMIVIFSYAATFEVRDIQLAVLNHDAGVYSRDLVARFDGSNNFRLVRALTHEREIAPVISSRAALMVLTIPETFSRDIALAIEARQGGFAADAAARVQVIVDGRQSNTGQIAASYAGSIVTAFAADIARQNGLSGPPARLEIRAWFNPALISQWYIVPGLVAMIVLVVTTNVTAMTVARERELGTFDQLLVTPVRPLEILAGKTIPPLIIGLVEGAVAVAIAVLWFKVPMNGHYAVMFGGMFFFLLAAIGVGLMISSIAETQQQAILGVFLFLFPSSILSGFASPIDNMDPWVQKVTYLNPLRYIMEILRGQFLEGTPIMTVVHHVWPLGVIALLSMSVAVWMFRHRLP